MKKFFKSFLIALLFAVGTIQAAAQAYRFEKDVTEDDMGTMTGIEKLDANSPQVRLAISYYPQERRSFLTIDLIKTNEFSSVTNSIARLGRQLPKEFSEKFKFKGGLTYFLSFANGEKYTDDVAIISSNHDWQQINYDTNSNGDNDFAIIRVDIPIKQDLLSALRSSNIVKLEIGGETFTFNGLRSADTFREMFEALGLSVQNSTNITASVEKIWVDHNVFENGVKGMRIHLKFNINGMLNKTGRAIAYFYYNNGNPLKDTNNRFYSVDGNVSVGEDFTPNYERCTFNDLTIFMPYSELELSQSAQCYFHVEIKDNNSQLRATSDKVYFDYNR